MHPEIDMTNLDVRHKCDNKHCINTEHLEHGTRKENIEDIYVRDRYRFKQFNLSNKEILDIAFNKELSDREMANKYNIKTKSVREIRSGKRWFNVTGIKYDPNLQQEREKREERDYLLDNKLRYIHKDKHKEIWRVLIKVKNKNYHIDRYKILEIAVQARDTYLLLAKNYLNETSPEKLKELCKVVKQMFRSK